MSVRSPLSQPIRGHDGTAICVTSSSGPMDAGSDTPPPAVEEVSSRVRST